MLLLLLMLEDDIFYLELCPYLTPASFSSSERKDESTLEMLSKTIIQDEIEHFSR